MPQVIPAVMTAISTIGAWQIGSFAIGSFLLNTVSSLALTAIAGALAGKPDFPKSGIQTEHTTAGSTEPRRFILGLTATAGHAITPPMTWDNKGENKNLTNVIVLSDAPVDSVIGWIVDGEMTTASATVGNNGRSLTGRFADQAWVEFHDGTQTTASTVLRNRLASYPERPITADMVMKDCAYVVATYHYSHENPRFSNIPSLRAIVRGMRVYDWRDPSQIWGDEATYEFSANPVVLIYNILRGIRIGNQIYGIGASSASLPTSYWTAAANICDEPSTVTEDIPSGFGWAFPTNRYRAGLEIGTDTEPLSAIDEFLRTCSGQLAEVGGQYIIRVAEPAMPSAHITDGVILADQPTEYTVTRGLESRHNHWGAKYPDPRQMFEENEAVPYFKQEWIDEDNGRRLDMSLSLPACPFPNQIPKLLRENAHDARRFREHTIVLPPSYIGLNLLDTISWSSDANNYSGKLFEIIGKTVDPHTLAVGLQLKERSPEDYIPNEVTDNRLPEIPSLKPVDPIITVHGFYATGFALKDTLGQDRRAAIQIIFDDDVNYDAISFEVRVKGSTEIFASGAIHDLSSGQHVVSESILGNTVYQVRVRPLASGIATEWGSWLDVTTPNIGLSADDIAMPIPAVPSGLVISTAMGSLTAIWNEGLPSVIYYDVSIVEGSADPIVIQTPVNNHTWTGIKPGLTYSVRVRSVNALGGKSVWSPIQTATGLADTIPPAVPSGLVIKSGFNTLWIEWDRNSTDDDFDYYELAAGTATNPTIIVARTPATNFALTELPDNATRYVRIRAVDTSGNRSDWTASVSGVTTDFPTLEVGDNTITAAKLVAGEVITLSSQVKDSIITNAHIANLSAAKLMAGSALASTITVSGEALASIQGKANDPAAQVNTGSTQIDPGKIVVSGATTLADWRMGGDETRIDGGAVAANTIDANKATIGMRGVTLTGIQFEHNSPNTDDLSWSAGHIRYINDSNTSGSVSITAGSATWSTGTLYVYWVKGETSFTTTTNLSVAMSPNTVVIATYAGDTNLNADYGRTVIDGDHIKTGGVKADNIDVDELSAITATMGALTVNNRLTITESGALLSFKSGPYDEGDGLFFGQTGADGFAFSAARTTLSGIRQSVDLRDTGFSLLNARHMVSASISPPPQVITTSQTITLPTGSRTLSLIVVGAGGSGLGRIASGSSNTQGPLVNGLDGTPTSVTLRDGTVVIQQWTASGGAGGKSANSWKDGAGQPSSLGAGGPQGRYVSPGGETVPTGGPGNPGIRGSGGGAGVRIAPGGMAGEAIVVTDYNVSSLANPNIVVECGVGGQSVGSGGALNASVSGKGGNGAVQYRPSTGEDIPADVVPLKPTAWGTFTSGTSGAFPDLGSGLWTVHMGTSNSGLGLGHVSATDVGAIRIHEIQTASFISSRTPTWTSGGSARTINYLFYKMGSWT